MDPKMHHAMILGVSYGFQIAICPYLKIFVGRIFGDLGLKLQSVCLHSAIDVVLMASLFDGLFYYS